MVIGWNEMGQKDQRLPDPRESNGSRLAPIRDLLVQIKCRCLSNSCKTRRTPSSAAVGCRQLAAASCVSHVCTPCGTRKRTKPAVWRWSVASIAARRHVLSARGSRVAESVDLDFRGNALSAESAHHSTNARMGGETENWSPDSIAIESCPARVSVPSPQADLSLRARDESLSRVVRSLSTGGVTEVTKLSEPLPYVGHRPSSCLLRRCAKRYQSYHFSRIKLSWRVRRRAHVCAGRAKLYTRW